MKLLLIFLGVIVGVIIFLSIIALIIYSKIKKFGQNLGYNNINQIKELIKQGEYDAKYKPKTVAGMTSLMIPKITKDFPNFSESELYNKVEISLRSIFKSLEDKSLSNNNELSLIKDNIQKIIESYKKNNIGVKYSEIKFHKHAIKYYKKDSGALNITVATSLEYYYEKTKNDKIIEENSDYKRQTSYTTEFIYIYDPDKYEKRQNLIGIHCPNCGAPVKSLSFKTCLYCSSGLEDINLKSWYISSYKEDY